jgi:hypothetical protein
MANAARKLKLKKEKQLLAKQSAKVFEPTVEEVVAPVVEDVEEIEESIIEGGTVTDVEVVEEEPVVKKKKKTKKN